LFSTCMRRLIRASIFASNIGASLFNLSDDDNLR
jgi:hypothetical protein